MLIDQTTFNKILRSYNINLNHILHIGAHDCQELHYYHKCGIKKENVVWIEALPEKVKQARTKGIPNIYQAVITDKDNQTVTFNISNNEQSSSIFDFKTHKIEHPWVEFVESVPMTTTTIDTFFKNNNLDASKYTFWNLDIQGAELLALKGGIESLKHVRVLYLEVNERELYKNCCLLPELDDFLKTHGFIRENTVMTTHGWGDAVYIKK